MLKKISVLGLLFLLLCSGSAYAIGRGPGARAAAMGGAYSAIAYGIEAYGFNPAGMATDKTFGAVLGVGGNSTLTWQEAQDLYTQLSTGTGRTQYLVSNIFQEIKINGQGDMPLVGISFGNLGIASWGYAYGYADKAMVDYQFLLYGGYILEYGVIYGDSFGKFSAPLKDLYWGITVRGITGGERGLYYSALDWDYNGDGSIVNFGREYSTSWTNGVGGDLGLKYEGDNYVIAFALKDIASTVTQTTELNLREIDWDDGTLGGIIGSYESSATATLDSRWLLGLAYYLEPVDLLITTDVESYKTASISPSDADFGKAVDVTDVHVGLEKRLLDWFALRAGYSLENYAKIPSTWITYGFGLNFGFMNIDLAAGNSERSSQVYLQAQTVL
ncbi:hypothetical protein ACFL5U_02645 [Candidatus Margulisiibacteriota bacterium]